MKIITIKVDGSLEEDFVFSHAAELAKLQEKVDGWVEPIRVGFEYDGKTTLRQAFVNEEGRPLGLPPNVRASEIAGQPIFGSMVIIVEGRLR